MNKSRASEDQEQRRTAHLEKKSKRDHVTPLLKELHRLPVKYRIQYKLATLAFRHFDGTLPPYLSSFLCIYQPSRSLRSSTERLLKIPKRFRFRSDSDSDSLFTKFYNNESVSKAVSIQT